MRQKARPQAKAARGETAKLAVKNRSENRSRFSADCQEPG